MEKILLVTVKMESEKDNWRIEDMTEELEALAGACAVVIIDSVSCVCHKPTAKFFIGSGKAQELAVLAQEEGVDTVVFGCDLSGTQQRNLEEIIGKKTIDRTQLILDIFARRARSPEGKMQVELAQMQYLMPRLLGYGIVMSRTGGGIGTSGPGEQVLEIDRRRIREKVDRLRKELKDTSRHREVMRKKRKDNALSSVALVGYTSAGKSTLLNALTDAGQAVTGHLFTTLDPLYKKLQLPNGENIVISDTVGFLHNLPHHLVEAFKATLEELTESDLLVHVLDVSHPLVFERNKAVLQVLSEFGAQDKPTVTVLNKIDLVEDKVWLARVESEFPGAVCVSAKLKQNLDVLLVKIQESFTSRMVKAEIIVKSARMDLVDLFYRQGRVEDIQYLQKGIKIELSLPKVLFEKLLHSREIEEVKD
ncbi:MAG: GTPase HflX [Candidatus Omnitrophota bacterium]|nr:GTPase HflX [Candidatus Omnitrophota bacterium]